MDSAARRKCAREVENAKKKTSDHDTAVSLMQRRQSCMIVLHAEPLCGHKARINRTVAGLSQTRNKRVPKCKQEILGRKPLSLGGMPGRLSPCRRNGW